MESCWEKMSEKRNSLNAFESILDTLGESFEHLKENVEELGKTRQNLQDFNIIFGNFLNILENVSTSVKFNKVSPF
jgi:prefoldin subunit 5